MATVVFDQSAFVKEAIKTLLHEGLIGLILTSLMILVFLGSFRATSAVFLSIPLSALATFVVLNMMGSTINTMILGGLALAFSRVIDNSVISLENIYRHLEMGAAPEAAAEAGGTEVSLAVLAATLTTVVVSFSRDVSLRGQQVSFFGSCSGGCDLALRLLLRGDDGDSAVLFTISEGCAPWRGTGTQRERVRSGAEHGDGPFLVGAVQRRVQPDVQPAFGFLRILGAASGAASGADGGRC